MLNMNRTTLGHAGRDPEIRALANGGKATTFSLATAERWKDRDGKAVEATQWHRVVVYGPVAGTIGRMLKKGDAVMVESLPRTRSGGRIATRTYQARDGVERSVTEIVVSGPQAMVNVLARRWTEDGEAGAGA